MGHNHSLMGLLGVCLASCGLVLLPLPPDLCMGMRWCTLSERMEILVFALTLPLLVSLGRAVYAGTLQCARTYRMIRALRKLPQLPLPSALRTVAQRLGIHNRLDVVDDPGPETFCYGLLRPRISVTTGLLAVLAPDELEAVLRHERHHLQRRDPLRTLLCTMTEAASWQAGDDRARMQLQRELAADRAVIAAGLRQPLAGALLKLLLQPQRRERPATELAISALSVTQARIDQLVQQNAGYPSERAWIRSRWYLIPTVLIIVPLLCVLAMVLR